MCAGWRGMGGGVMDVIGEGIQIAVDGVRNIMREQRVGRTRAIQRALAGVRAGRWWFENYGADADAVREACDSELVVMARECDR